MTDLEKLTVHYEPNEKRPFGNSDIEMDVADILGWELFIDSNEEPQLSKKQYEEAQRLTKLVKDSYCEY